MYMEIHVHSTLAMLEVGRKQRQPRHTVHTVQRPDKQDIYLTNHTKIGKTLQIEQYVAHRSSCPHLSLRGIQHVASLEGSLNTVVTGRLRHS